MGDAASIDPRIEPGWKQQLAPEFQKPGFRELKDFLVAEKAAGQRVYPPGSRIFAAFDDTPWDRVKVVILGQDPYHGPGQANGLCFSVGEGIPFPPSLRNIYKELEADLGIPVPVSGDLSPWAKQGVLLLNATLTVRAHEAGSHQNRGWEPFTDAVIHAVNEQKENVVFILWGSYARKKASFIDRNRHSVIESPHPSPLSAHRGFFGSKPFSRCNAALEARGISPVDWSLGDPRNDR